MTTTTMKPDLTPAAQAVLPMLTAQDVATLLAISLRQVQRLARADKLPGAVWLGSSLRFRTTEIKAFIEGKDNVFSAMRKKA